MVRNIQYIMFSIIFVFLTFSIARSDASSPKIVGLVQEVTFPEKNTGICITNKAVYLSKGDPTKWSAIYGVKENQYKKSIIALALGVSKQIIFIESDINKFIVKSYSQNTGVQSLCEVPTRYCSFISEQVGCYVNGSKLMLTFDEGKTWKTRDVFPSNEAVTGVVWLSLNEIVVGGAKGTVAMYSVDSNGVIKQLWIATLSGPIQGFRLSDSDILWALENKLVALNRRNGEKLEAITPDIPVEGFMPTAKFVYFWGYEGASVWEKVKDNFVSLHQIKCPPVAGIFPQETKIAIIITMDGKFLNWNLESGKLQTMAVEVNNVALSQEEELDKDRATREGQREVMQLSLKVPFEVRQKIFAEARSKKELTPKERVEWATKEFRKAITAK